MLSTQRKSLQLINILLIKRFPIGILFFFLCFACHQKEEESSRSQCMRICLRIDPTSLDPRKNSDPCTSCVNFLIYEGLTQMGTGGSTELALAKSVDISEDGRVYTFHLRVAVWSDGTPITASDF